jgi:hypothetical protein
MQSETQPPADAKTTARNVDFSLTGYLRKLSLARIEAGYQRGDFGIGTPTNPREHGGVAGFALASWVALLVATIMMASWPTTWIALAAAAASIAAGLLLDTYVELPKTPESTAWMHENYGCSTRCGHWRPITRLICAGLWAPIWCVGGFIAWRAATYVIALVAQ